MNPDPTSLDRLHDILVPASTPWWPPAPGWYWVLGFVLVLAIILVLATFIRWQHNRYRREALAELRRMEGQWKNATARATALLALAELLKRTALTAFPREQVASLTGPSWFAFLDRTAPGARFSGGLGAMLENAIHHPGSAATLADSKCEELANAIHHWIKHHKVESDHMNLDSPVTNKSASSPFTPLPPVQNPSAS